MVTAVEHFITTVVAQYGYPAVFLLMLLGSACIPIPSEAIMLFGGALVSVPFLAPEQQLAFWPVVIVGTAGSIAGSWLAYWLGYKGGRPLIDRWGRYLLFRPHEVDRAHAWFERHGEAAVFFGRLIPLIRAFISLPAGVAQMRFWRFSLYTLLGCLIWNIAFAYAGTKLGENWAVVTRYMQPIAIVVAIVAAGLIVWWITGRLRARGDAEA